MHLRPFQSTDLPAIRSLISRLHPHWFDHQALVNIPKDMVTLTTTVAVNPQLVGFISGYAYWGAGYLAWMGVDPKLHRQGIGSALLTHLINFFQEQKIDTLSVETIVYQDPPDGSYDLTLKFYQAHGFQLQAKKPLEFLHPYSFRRGFLIKTLL